MRAESDDTAPERQAMTSQENEAGNIKPRVERAIEEALGPAADELEAEVEHGVVFLEGAGVAPEDLERAERAARTVPGVRDVVDNVYSSGAPKSDAEIEHDVRVAIAADGNVEQPERIRVVVKNGAVWLEGSVGSVPERGYAMAAAKTISWVVEVYDTLEVEPRPAS
jgi:osmotically-inducible protein OsmY